jgi:hypothetical protein
MKTPILLPGCLGIIKDKNMFCRRNMTPGGRLRGITKIGQQVYEAAQHVHYEPLELSHDESHQSGSMLHHQMDVPSSQDCIECHFYAMSSVSRFPRTCIAVGSSV